MSIRPLTGSLRRAARSTALESELEEVQGELEQGATERDELRRANEELVAEQEKLREQVEALEATQPAAEELAAAKASLETLEVSHAAAEEQVAALRAEVQRLEAAKREVDEELAQCRGEVEETSSTLAAAMTELDSTKDEVTELEKVLDELRDQLKRGEDERSALEQERSELSGSVAAAREAAVKAEAVQASLREELAAKGDRESAEVEALRQELEVQRSRFSDASRALAELRDLHSQAHEELVHLRSAASDASGRDHPAPEREESDDALRLQISEAQAKIRQLEQDVFSLDSTRIKMLKANGDLKSQVESMMDALARARARGSTEDSGRDVLMSPSRAVPTSNEHQAERRQPPSSYSPSPAPPARRGHAHRRTASTLAPVSELSDTSQELEDVAGYRVDGFDPDEGGDDDADVEPLTPLGSPPVVTAINTPAMSHAGTPMPRHSSVMGDPLPDAAPQVSRTSRGDHVRRESLSLLKARMEDELGVPDLDQVSPVSPGRSGVVSPGLAAGDGAESDGLRTRRVPLARDLVWCAACRGDLFVV